MNNPVTKPKDPPYRGLDAAKKDRPGAQRETAPRPLAGARWTEPEQQPIEGSALVPGELDRRTPVFSTALPPRGMSGALRRSAHRIPDHRAVHWMLLLLADRIDVLESFHLRILRSG